MLLLLLDTLLVLAFALLAAASLRLPTRAAHVLGVWLIMFAAIILPVQIAGMLSVLNERAVYLGAHLALLAAGGYLWQRTGRPALDGPFNLTASLALLRQAAGGGKAARALLPLIRADLALWLFGIGVWIGYLIGALVIVITPPLPPDDMLYHFARIAFWMQHDSLRHWDTYKMHQVVFPINGELGMAWTMIFTRTDALARFIHWAAAPAAGAVMIGLVRLLGGSRREGLFAALFVLATPQVYLQAISANNDLLLGALFGSTVYLLILGLRTDHKGVLGLSALALGIAPGVKLTLYTLALGLAALLLILWWEHGRRGFTRLLGWGIAALAAFVVFSSYYFILNWIDYDSPVGPAEFRENESVQEGITPLELLRDNPPRYVYQSFDVTGIPRRLSIPLHEAKVRIAKPLFEWLGQDDPAESETVRGRGKNLFYLRPVVGVGQAWFGPLGVLLLWAILPQTIWAIRQQDRLRLALVLIAWGFWITFSMLTSWSLYRGRYVTLLVILIAPLIVPLYRWRVRRWFRPVYWGICALSVLVLITTQVSHDQLPLTGAKAIWDRSDMDIWRADGVVYPAFAMVEKHVPDDAHLGLYFKTGDKEYPFFGRRFTRTVTPIYPYPERVDAEWLAAQHFDYIIINQAVISLDDLPPELEVVERGVLYALLRYTARG